MFDGSYQLSSIYKLIRQLAEKDKSSGGTVLRHSGYGRQGRLGRAVTNKQDPDTPYF